MARREYQEVQQQASRAEEFGETFVRQLGETLVEEYPVLTEEDVRRLLEDDAPVSPQTDDEEAMPEPPPAAKATAEGSRALYGYAPSRRTYGAVALAATVQSDGFRPAGLSPRRGRRASVYPAINGVYRIT